jgi:hypothetical protein
MDLKKGPSGSYTRDQWVVSSTVDEDGKFVHRWRYLGEPGWYEGEPSYKRITAASAGSNAVQNAVAKRINMLEFGFKEPADFVMGPLKAVVQRAEDKERRKWTILALVNGVAPERREIELAKVPDELELAAALDLCIELAAWAEQYVKPIRMIVTDVKEEGEGKTELTLTGDQPVDMPPLAHGEDDDKWAIKPGPPNKVVQAHAHETPDPKPPTPHTDVAGHPLSATVPVAVHPASPMQVPDEPPQPPPPMDAKPVPMRCSPHVDGTALVHRMLASLAPPLPAHAIAAAVLNICERAEMDPHEFVKELRGTLQRCAQKWGTNE